MIWRVLEFLFWMAVLIFVAAVFSVAIEGDRGREPRKGAEWGDLYEIGSDALETVGDVGRTRPRSARIR